MTAFSRHIRNALYHHYHRRRQSSGRFALCRDSNHHQQQPQKCQQWQGCRSVVTTALIEPPLDSDIPERPCTVILATDPPSPFQQQQHHQQSSSKPHSLRCPPGTAGVAWEQSFCDMVPRRLGMSCGAISWSSSVPPTMNSNNDGADTWLQWIQHDGLHEMTSDLHQVQMMGGHVVLIANGPWSSWMAQWYLESHALAGLVMINPLVVDVADHEQQQHQTQFELLGHNDLPNAWELLFGNVPHTQPRPLLLEPGAVPMMVVKTSSSSNDHEDTIWTQHAQATAQRHSLRLLNGSYENDDDDVVPVARWIIEDNTDSVDVLVETILVPWIESHVW
mmetsp:Transcript_9633/g.28865  ORF Transcript_9633/g.28865 Transcript_9633/m.28865 type:complete len:334 (+) Transcript_9633:77-1078(+)